MNMRIIALMAILLSLVLQSSAQQTPTANWSLASEYGAYVDWTEDGGSTTSMTATFELLLEVADGAIHAPASGDFKIVARIGREDFLCKNVTVLVNPMSSTVSTGQTPIVTVRASLPQSTLIPVSGYGRGDPVIFRMVQISWQSAGVAQAKVVQTHGLESLKTLPVSIVTTSTPVRANLNSISATLWDEVSTMGAERVVSEGRFLQFSPDSTSPQWVIFPAGSAGQMAEVTMSVTSIGLGVQIQAPKEIGTDSRADLAICPLLNLEETRDGPQVTAVRFEVLFGGLRAYGEAIRTGDRSALLKFYWGTSASQGHPGEVLDMLDLSGSSDPAKGKRFPFGVTSLEPVDGGFLLSARTLANTRYVVESSIDLIGWLPAIDLEVIQSEPGSGLGSIETIWVPMLNPPDAKRFYRLAIP